MNYLSKGVRLLEPALSMIGALWYYSEKIHTQKIARGFLGLCYLLAWALVSIIIIYSVFNLTGGA